MRLAQIAARKHRMHSQSDPALERVKRLRDMRRFPKGSHQLTPNRMIANLQKWFLLSDSLSVNHS
jgi:hypothetical protein